MTSALDLKKFQIMANVIASAFSVDVGVVDQNMTAIAGTGVYSRNIGVKRPKESYVVQSIAHGEDFFLKNATYGDSCYRCEIRKSCPFTMVSFHPIISGNRVNACIMLLASSDEHRKILSRKLSEFKRNLSKVHVLFSDLYHKHKDYDAGLGPEIGSIMDLLEEALLVTDRTGKINFINSGAQDVLRCRKGDLLGGNIDELLFTESCRLLLSGKQAKSQYLSFPMKQDLIFSAKPILIKNIFQGYVIRLDKRNTRVPALPIASKMESFTRIIGNSSVLKTVINEARRVANTNSTVLLLGETGTGKELFASGIHQESFRCKNPFVVMNCSALPDNLLESEMFGYEEGAFTGSKKGGKIGKFEAADHGTLFLDEIGDLPLALQSKLLRVLEDGYVEKLGSTKRIKVDVRIIAATNRNLPEMISKGTFREDLYYRLNVIPIFLPPLRERKDDIPILIDHFTSKICMNLGITTKSISHEVQHLFMNYPWPGNIRELKNTLEHLLQAASGNTIHISDLPHSMRVIFYKKIRDHESNELSIDTLRNLEQEAIENALKRFGYTTEGKRKAAKSLGISVATLYRRLSIYNNYECYMNSKDIRIIVKYCGGCNPRYDRREFVDRFFEITAADSVVRVLPGSPADYVLLVSGCVSSCANNTDNYVLAKNTLVVNEESDFQTILQAISDKNPKNVFQNQPGVTVT